MSFVISAFIIDSFLWGLSLKERTLFMAQVKNPTLKYIRMGRQQLKIIISKERVVLVEKMHRGEIHMYRRYAPIVIRVDGTFLHGRSCSSITMKSKLIGR